MNCIMFICWTMKTYQFYDPTQYCICYLKAPYKNWFVIQLVRMFTVLKGRMKCFWSRRRHIYESMIKMCYNTTHTKGTTSETHIKTKPRWPLNGYNLLSNNCHQVCTLVIHTHYVWINKIIKVCYCHWVDTFAGEIIISPSAQQSILGMVYQIFFLQIYSS